MKTLVRRLHTNLELTKLRSLTNTGQYLALDQVRFESAVEVLDGGVFDVEVARCPAQVRGREQLGLLVEPDHTTLVQDQSCFLYQIC